MLSEKSIGDLTQMTIDNLRELNIMRAEIRVSKYKELWERQEEMHGRLKLH